MPSLLLWRAIGGGRPSWFAPRRLFALLVWGIVVTLYAARTMATEVPALEGRVNDHARIVSPEMRQQLTSKLEAYERLTGHQLAILTIPTLGGDAIEDFTIRTVEAWKLGKKGADDGLLLLVASGDKKLRIEVGYGLEGALPDAAAGRIIRDVITPYFRRGDYSAGIGAGVDAIFAATGGESLVGGGARSNARQPTGSNPWKAAPAGPVGWIGWMVAVLLKLAFFGIFGVFGVIILLANLLGRGRSRRTYIGGGGFGDSSFGGGSFGGGGGDSFSGGGGSFGGGGASGDW